MSDLPYPASSGSDPPGRCGRTLRAGDDPLRSLVLLKYVPGWAGIRALRLERQRSATEAGSGVPAVTSQRPDSIL
jgi:hypothetical protein